MSKETQLQFRTRPEYLDFEFLESTGQWVPVNDDAKTTWGTMTNDEMMEHFEVVDGTYCEACHHPTLETIAAGEDAELFKECFEELANLQEI